MFIPQFALNILHRFFEILDIVVQLEDLVKQVVELRIIFIVIFLF